MGFDSKVLIDTSVMVDLLRGVNLAWYKEFHLSHGVGFLDCLIAASAFKKSIPIATLNDKHFKHFAGISVIRPY